MRIMPLDLAAQSETPADPDIQINQICLESTERGHSSVGRCHHSIDEPNAAASAKAQAKVGVLHDCKCFIATVDGQEVGSPEKHGVVTEQESLPRRNRCGRKIIGAYEVLIQLWNVVPQRTLSGPAITGVNPARAV